MRFSPDSTVMIRPRGYQAHRKITKVLHEDLRWRVHDLSPIFVRELDKGNSECSFYECGICLRNP